MGLITGCFDLVHVGHVKLFSFAKKYCDILVIGVESDETVRLSKGNPRPINRQGTRMKNLSYEDSIDYIFPIDLKVKFGSVGVSEKYVYILKLLKPDLLITNKVKDKYWKEKKEITEKLKIGFVAQREKENVSTTEILKRLKIIS